VELVFQSRTAKGKITKNARILSNDSTRTSVTIDFTANIFTDPDTISLVRFIPSILEFNKESKKYAVNVENRGESQLKLSLVNSPSDDIKVKFKEGLLEGGDSRKIEFEWKGSTPEYDVAHGLTFATGDIGVARFTVPYTIKGEKGPRPGKTPEHAKKPTTNPNQPLPPKGAGAVPAADLKSKVDTTKVVEPLPAASWPPKSSER
jgi:hypothetical protein